MSKEQILSSDGIPLELSLKKAERKNKLKAVIFSCTTFFIYFNYLYFQLGICFLEVLMIE
jgi:putative spermidine/putrescine transport system permease protein